MIESVEFAAILMNRLKESNEPTDSKILSVLDGSRCELIEFKIGAMFESLKASPECDGNGLSPFRAVFKTKPGAAYDPDVYDARLLEVCREIIPLTGTIIADVSVEDEEDEEEDGDDDITLDKLIREDISCVCAEDFASGEYANATAKAADIFADEIFDKEISKEDCVEILRMLSRCLEKFGN